MMEVTKMSNTKKTGGQDPAATGGQDPATMQDVKTNALTILINKDGAFNSMYNLNKDITTTVILAIMDFLIDHNQEANPVTSLKDNPLLEVWNAFFQTYNVKIESSETNKKNPQQSYRNMLATFPSKIKYVMLALDECGLKNSWIIPKNSKKQSLSEADIKEVDALLQKTGILNPSMDIASRYKVFKALGGKLTSRKETKTE